MTIAVCVLNRVHEILDERNFPFMGLTASTDELLRRHFKSIEACDPQEGFLAITMPANLRSVEITLSQKAHCESSQRELFLFFLHNPSAETLQRFIYNPSKAIAVDSKPALFVYVSSGIFLTF
jgi:hypothetical protein